MTLVLHISPSASPIDRADPVQALRSATQAQHTLLDSSLPLARPDAGLADYLQHLAVLQGWMAELAPLLARTPWGGGYLQALRDDLDEAGDAGTSALASVADAAGDPAADVPGDGSLAYALGVAYVVEGSQLGGQVLLRRLRQAGLAHGLRYLEGRGAATGAHWGAFLKALRASLTEPADVAAACAGAHWAFDTLLARFRRLGVLA